jgi:hypothetical protein
MLPRSHPNEAMSLPDYISTTSFPRSETHTCRLASPFINYHRRLNDAVRDIEVAGKRQLEGAVTTSSRAGLRKAATARCRRPEVRMDKGRNRRINPLRDRWVPELSDGPDELGRDGHGEVPVLL